MFSKLISRCPEEGSEDRKWNFQKVLVVSDFERKISACVLYTDFYVSIGKILNQTFVIYVRKFWTSSKNFSNGVVRTAFYLSTGTIGAFSLENLIYFRALSEKFLAYVGRTAFYVSRGTFWGKTFGIFFQIMKFFRLWVYIVREWFSFHNIFDDRK